MAGDKQVVLKTVETDDAVINDVIEDEVIEPRQEDIAPKRPWYAATVIKVIIGSFLLIFQLALVAAVIFGGYMGMQRLTDARNEPPSRPKRERVYTVDLAAVKIENYRPLIQVFGEIASARSVDLRVLASGEIVSVKDGLVAGSLVEAGESLVEVDRFAYEGAVTEAEAGLLESRAKLIETEARISSETDALMRAEEQLTIAGRDLARAEQLRKNGDITARGLDDRKLVVSQREQSVEQRRNNLIVERARLEQQKAALKRQDWRLAQAKRNLDNTVLKAPFSGVVSLENVEIGRILNANDVAVQVYDNRLLEVRFTLSDRQYGSLLSDNQPLAGRPVTVHWDVGSRSENYDAVINRTAATIAADRGGVQFIAILKSEAVDHLRPGAFVEVSVPGAEIKNAVKVPETAVYSGDHVFVSVDGVLEKRLVRVEAYSGDGVLLSGDLKSGDQVLTTRIAEIGEGLKVRTVKPKPGQKPDQAS